MTARTDLEHVILGIVAKFGPCTTYTVRRHFEVSPAQYFSASTGSVYPAVRRLERAKLLARRADARGRQRRTMYRITDGGTAALRAWLSPPLGKEAFATPYDPLRTRLYFLTELPSKRRREFVREAIRELEARLPALTEYVNSYPDAGATRMSRLAARGCLYATEAQITWLREVERAL